MGSISSSVEAEHSWATSLLSQKKLNEFYLRQLGSPADFKNVPKDEECLHVRDIERKWNGFEESRIDFTNLPCNTEEFIEWYKRVHLEHRQAVNTFFMYLANESTLEELAFYIAMEEQVDGRFDDVIALSQLGMSGDMKMALAENYWDEMGLGKLNQMHTTLFLESSSKLKKLCSMNRESLSIPAESLKNGNLLMMYALRRKYFPRLLGAISILEHTAPYRFKQTVRAMERHKVPEDVIYYHRLHLTVDANHGKQLLNRVLIPLTRQCPEAISEICAGCLIRLNVAGDYYQSVEREMKVSLAGAPSLNVAVEQ